MYKISCNDKFTVKEQLLYSEDFSFNRRPVYERELSHARSLRNKSLTGFNVLDLGLIDYRKALDIQKETVSLVRDGMALDTLIFCEHKDVITVGRGGSISNILESREKLKQRNIEVIFVDRGGDVTYHGKGQLVIYPIVDLRKRQKDVHLFLRRLELVVINFLKFYHIYGYITQGKTGVWVNSEKIASIGIALTKWVTYHGVSININPHLDYFSLINPCGLKDVKMTSVNRILKRTVNMQKARQILKREFKRVF